ncbi:SAV_915 family protein [Nocardioides xinjiangensis]|uniref:SAV_915 family protein n=1 Tax=Nocardioides xinjiangensis TaxID=2817376 RepID=UPI001B30D4DA|nr:SAV_915 family protein [Nocardioides sp. SYSU D00778]
MYAPTIDLDGATRIRMHEMRDGRTALFVYSAIDRLEEQYGDDARWVLLGVDDLQHAFEQVPYDLLFLDRELHPEGARGE